MKCEWILNCGIEYNPPLDIESEIVKNFSTSIVHEIPELTQTERDTENGRFCFFEQGKEARVRQVQISKDSGLQVGAQDTLTYEEQMSFVRKVIRSAEILKISKFNITMADVRKIFFIKHWGNHHDLLAKSLFKGGALGKMFDEIECPLSKLDLNFNVYPLPNEDIVFGTWAYPRTRRSEIRSGEYAGNSLTLVCGVARVGGFVKFDSLWEMFEEVIKIWDSGLTDKVIKNLVKPLLAVAVGKEPKAKK
jgi:hypothetical protein